MTEKNLWDAFAGESQAHMKYLAFGDKAEKEGFSNIARLFKATGFAEQIHATKHLRTLDGIKSTTENLQTAINGEQFEQQDMYPAYVAVAELEGEKAAKKSAEWALESEKLHEALYRKAKESVDSGKDMEIKHVYVCPICGYTHEGESPEDRCPICKVPGSKFVKF